ncbi:MAG: M18 family aminopeptidase [Roseburia sp.]|nr:M18 family aminopeptidase [Roseburia sp.]
MDDIQELMHYLDESLTSYHAVANAARSLRAAGFTELTERDCWRLERGGAYYVIRNDSSLMAFCVPDCEMSAVKGFHIYAAHSDSPAFKLKEKPEMTKEEVYLTVNTERYGEMILSTWMDRPLTIAGRVCVEREGEIQSCLVRLKDNLCMIPNLAIHMNREMNNGVALNAQTDMIPLVMMKQDGNAKTVNTMLAEALRETAGAPCGEADILAADLFVENSEKAVLAGADNEFIMSARYDDLACVFAGMKGLLAAKPSQYINVLAVFDNEEVGSLTRQGADSTLLKDTLENIADGMGVSGQTYRIWKAESFLLSADNAHACHPNQGAKADPTNRPCLNQGVVLKYHGRQKYATDACSAAYVKRLCRQNDIPLQTYANRSDIMGGSTLGNLVMAQVSMAAADIGLPQLAMHSAYETGGARDVAGLIALARAFFMG